MRICIDVEWKDHVVCILGGGKVALRKASQFLKADAHIYISSLEYLDEFEKLPVMKCSYPQLVKTLDQCTLAIAATDDPRINQQFIQEAKKRGVLAMSAQKDLEQDCFSMMESRNGDLVLACHTNGAYPIANKAILKDWQDRLQDLRVIRDHLQDHRYCETILNLDPEHISFLRSLCERSKGIVVLVHGNHSQKAKIQIKNLCQRIQEEHQYPTTFLFMATQYRDISIENFCQILKELKSKVHFVDLFWGQGRYMHQIQDVLETYHFMHQWIRIDAAEFVGSNETLIQHTLPNSRSDSSVVVSMLDSPFLKKQYPNSRFVACLEQKEVIERIVHEIHPTF